MKEHLKGCSRPPFFLENLFFSGAPPLKKREGWLFAWPLLADIRTPVLSPLAGFCLQAGFFFFFFECGVLFELLPVRTVGPAGAHSANRKTRYV